MSNHEEDFSSEKSLHGQPALQKFYYGTSMLYCGQVLLSLKKYSGFTLKGFNSVLGPYMAAWIALLLAESAKNKYLGFDTFKRLNGLLFLFPQISLCMLALSPNHIVFESDGILWLVSSFLAIFTVTKGYFSGLRADGDKSFLPETLRLLKAAASLTMSLPPKTMTYPNFIRLATIAIRKTILLGGVINALWFGDGIVWILPKLAQLGKLTLLGGSIVTSVSVEPNEMARNMTTGPINCMSFIAFLLMSAFTLVKASSALELVDGLLLSICAICSAFEGLNQSSKGVVTPKND